MLSNWKENVQCRFFVSAETFDYSLDILLRCQEEKKNASYNTIDDER